MNRREALTSFAKAAVAAVPVAAGLAHAEQVCVTGKRGPRANYFPNVVLLDQDGRKVKFYDDLVEGKTVLFNLFYTRCTKACPAGIMTLLSMQKILGDRMGKDIFFYSFTVDPEHDTPAVLKDFANEHEAGPGWTFYTGKPEDLDLLRKRLGFRDIDPVADQDKTRHITLLRYGNEKLDRWAACPAMTSPEQVVKFLSWLEPIKEPRPGVFMNSRPDDFVAQQGLGSTDSDGGFPGSTKNEVSTERLRVMMRTARNLSLAFALTLGATSFLHAQVMPPLGPCTGLADPYPANRPVPPTVQNPDSQHTVVVTANGQYPASDIVQNAPGSNFILTTYKDVFTDNCVQIPNTTPSTPTIPYNLINGPVQVTPIDPTSPKDDLLQMLNNALAAAKQRTIDTNSMQFALNVLEGNQIPSRPTYSGTSLLHYTGPERLKTVTPIYDGQGNVIGGTVNVHQVWMDNHIETDTALIDPTAVWNVPWQIVYTIDVLHHGADDFAPYVMYLSDPPAADANAPAGTITTPTTAQGPPLAAMDATFFPMDEGKKYVLTLKMGPAKYWNLTYHWGWRIHPPRVQVIENALKSAGGKTLYQWETSVFGVAPRSSRAAQIAAINMIGNLAPEKIMWNDLNTAIASTDPNQVASLIQDALLSFDDWSDRTRLPRGFTADPNSNLTVVFANNTMYAAGPNGPGVLDFPSWTLRPGHFKVSLVNADYFVHGYVNVDFGGSRGWANMFQQSGGNGCGFTFGRDHWFLNNGGPFGAINTPPATPQPGGPDLPGTHFVDTTLNFEPTLRLRIYQFDPFHHDYSVYSLH